MDYIKPKQIKNSSTHEELLYNLFYYKDKKYDGTKIFKKLIHNKNTNSLNGYIYEALIRVLIFMKCFINLDCEHVYEGKISECIKKTNLKKISNEKIHQGGNGVDILVKTEDGTYIGFSVKYKKVFNARNTDCDIINTEFKKTDLKYKVGFITKDKTKVYNHKYLSEKEDYCVIMRQLIKDMLIFDKSDVIASIDNFIEMYKNIKITTLHGMEIKEVIEYIDEKIYNVKRISLIQRLHQTLTIKKFINNYKHRYHLVPHVPRSGKSITLLLMAKYMFVEKNMKRILLFTSVPATIMSFINVLNRFYDFSDINYKNQGEQINDKSWTGIYFCSIQYLKMSKKSDKEEKMRFLKDMKFDALISDEAHIGSSTDKSRTNIINIDTDFDNIQRSIKKVIFASGTPGKTKKYYGIKTCNVYEWDYIDNNLMKQEKYEFMSKRHGIEFKECMEKKNIDKTYTKYPIQILERYQINNYFVKQIKQYNSENNENFGFDFNSLFELVQCIEHNKVKYQEKFKLCETECGKDMLVSILNKFINEHPMQRKNSIMYSIEQLQSRYNSRKSTIENPKLFIVYLPTNSQFSNIEPLQKTLYKFLLENDLWYEYNIEYTNSQSNSLGHKYKNYCDFIDTIMMNTRKNKKKGCILFLGEQGTTGITYHDCDVTISLDNGKSLDNEKQKQARAMTDAVGKTVGINIDMNMQRCFSMVVDKCNTFRKITKENMNNAEIMKYMFLSKLFVFDSSKMKNLGEIHESEVTKHYNELASEISQQLNDDIYLEDLECNDMLCDFIKGNVFTKAYTQNRIEEETDIINDEISKLYDGLNKEIPLAGKEKVLAVIEEKKNSIKNIEQEIEEEVIVLVNKTLEVMKSWLMPYIIILSIKYKYSNVAQMMDDIERMGEIITVMKEKKIEFKLTNKNVVLIKEAMESIIESNSDIVNNIREIYENADPRQYRKLIEKHFIPSMEEKKQNAEVPTPVKLVDEMLGKIPCDFWTKENKVFEPCCGKGNFVLGIFYKLYDGLKVLYPNEYDRCKVIIEECLYYADISTLNVFITTEILKCEVQSRCSECDFSEWKFNTYVGDTLELNIKETFGVDGFDAVIGNPPYNSHGDTGTGNTIWQNFTRKSLDNWLVNDGYLVFVHPPGWRKPNTKRGKFYGMYKQMTKKNQMIYLSIHGIKDGQKTFNCGTRYDWYVIKNTPKTKKTFVNDENNKELDIDMSKFEWLPNSNIDVVQKLLANDGEEKCKIIYSPSAYEHRKKWMSKVKNNKYKFPCIHSTPKNGIRYLYSNVNDKGHFGVSKVIFGETGIYNCIIDINGDYGLTNGCIGIEIDNVENGKAYKKFLESEKMLDIIKSCSFSSFRVDWNIFKDLKKDFWKEFV